MVGRDDGVLEVYSMDDSNQPRLQFTHVSQLANTLHYCGTLE